jgi:hypothetical protein
MKRPAIPKPTDNRGVSEGFSGSRIAGSPLRKRVWRWWALESHPGGGRSSPAVRASTISGHRAGWANTSPTRPRTIVVTPETRPVPRIRFSWASAGRSGSGGQRMRNALAGLRSEGPRTAPPRSHPRRSLQGPARGAGPSGTCASCSWSSADWGSRSPARGGAAPPLVLGPCPRVRKPRGPRRAGAVCGARLFAVRLPSPRAHARRPAGGRAGRGCRRGEPTGCSGRRGS